MRRSARDTRLRRRVDASPSVPDRWTVERVECAARWASHERAANAAHSTEGMGCAPRRWSCRRRRRCTARSRRRRRACTARPRHWPPPPRWHCARPARHGPALPRARSATPSRSSRARPRCAVTPAAAEVDGDGPGQSHHGRLRRGVGGLVPHGHDRPGHAGHVDDAPEPPRGHVRHRVLAHQEGGVEVAGQPGPPRGQAHRQQAARLGAAPDAEHAGVVDDDVQGAVRRNDLVDEASTCASSVRSAT